MKLELTDLGILASQLVPETHLCLPDARVAGLTHLAFTHLGVRDLHSGPTLVWQSLYLLSCLPQPL